MRDRRLRERLGRRGREMVKRHFLISRTVEESLDLIASFETNFRITPQEGAPPGVPGPLNRR